MKKTALLLLALFSLQAQAQRIVVLTPDTAEIVAQLGAANEVVAVHEHNHHPQYQNKPTIGFYRTLSAEPIIAQKPDLVVGSYMAIPPTIYARLKQSGVNAYNVNSRETLQDYTDGIKQLGKLIGKTQAAEQLAAHMQNSIKPMPATGKRYLLSYDGRHVAGRGTVGDTLIKLAGGINAANVDGLKPLSREGWLAAKPDVIIIAKHNESMVGGTQKLAARPEVAGSNAAQQHNIHFWAADDFLRFGLHTPKSIQRLNQLVK